MNPLANPKLFVGLVAILLLASFDPSPAPSLSVGNEPRFFVRYNTAYITNAAFSPDAKILATVSQNKIELWNPQTGQRIGNLGSHKDVGSSNVSSLEFSDNGQYLVSSTASQSHTNHVKLWHLPSKRLVRRFAPSKYISSVAISPDGSQVAVAGKGVAGAKGYSVSLWQAANGQKIATLDQKPAVQYVPDSLVFSSGGGYLLNAVQNARRGIQIWDVAKQKLHRYIQHPSDIVAIDLSPDGKRIVGGGMDKKIHVWDFHSGKHLFALSGPKRHITDVAFHPQGRYVASTQYHSRPKFWLWNLKKKKAHHRQTDTRQSSQHITFSPNGRYLAVTLITFGNAGNPRRLEVFDVGSSKRLSQLGANNDMSTFAKGDKVLAKYKGKTYPGRVGKVGKRNYWVYFQNRKPKRGAWLKPGALKPASAQNRNEKPNSHDTGGW